MCTCFKLISHVDIKRIGTQSLKKHITEVSDIMIKLYQDKGMKDQEFLYFIRILGLCHDFGKGSSYFQKYIRGEYKGDLKNHGEISAYFTYYYLKEEWKLRGFICVKRHHGNIDDLDNLFFTPTENISKIISSIEENKDELEEIYDTKLDGFIDSIKDGTLFRKVKEAGRKRKREFNKKNYSYALEKLMELNFAWSLLLTADKSQLIVGKAFENREILKGDDIEKYKEVLREKMLEKNKEILKSDLFKVREQIWNEAKEKINNIDLDKDRIISINVPTGTGKTIVGYGSVFYLLERIKKETEIKAKFIYGINFTSVIDQNFNVLKEIMEFSNKEVETESILKYHSLTEIEYRNSEGIEYKEYDGKFLFDNWQSSIIVTTFVQIFNAILKVGLNSNTHKFHNIIGSVIVLDEVQAISPKLHKMLDEIFKILTEKYNCFIITITATKPLFLEGIELIKNKQEIFRNMNRIVVESNIQNKTDIEDFKRIIIEDINENKEKSFLFILNTVAAAKEIKKFLDGKLGENRKVKFLNSEIIPLERAKIIRGISKNNKGSILVSTQIVEAGVDIDFDVVYRDLAPLDAINQSAGRANRNGINGKGIVKVYWLSNSEGKVYSTIYSSVLVDITRNLLKEKIIYENQMLELNDRYFSEVKKVSRAIGEEILEGLKNDIIAYNYESIRKKLDLIENQDFKEDIIIRYNEAVNEDIKIIENSNEYLDVLNAYVRLNRYRISIRTDLAYKLGYDYPKIGKIIDKENYEKEYGIIEKITTSL